jgi:hypothetical protein
MNMAKRKEFILVQHVLPEDGLHGMYDGRETRYVQRERKSGETIIESHFSDTGWLCKVQTTALRLLAKDDDILVSLRDILMDKISDVIQAAELDPEQCVVHMTAQWVLGEPQSVVYKSTDPMLITVEAIKRAARMSRKG